MFGLVKRFLSRWYLTSRGVTRWLRRRFTIVGFALLVAMAVTLGTANHEQTMGFPAFLVLATVWLMALISAPFFRLKFQVTREVPPLVTAGTPFTMQVHLSHASRQVQAGLAYAEELHEPQLTSDDVMNRLREVLTWRPQFGLGTYLVRSTRPARCVPVAVPNINPGAICTVAVSITAWRRGPLELAAGVVMRTDPFGVFQAFCRTPKNAPSATILVLPARFPLPPLALLGQSREQSEGTALATGVGQAEEFVALRDYRRGDPLKHVHWRSVARTGRVVVKEFQDEHLMRHGLVLDTCCAPRDDLLFEEAVAVAASFVCTVPDQESLLDLLLVDRQALCLGSGRGLTSGRGLGSTQRMLEVLATVQPTREREYAALVALVGQHRESLSSCVVVLLAWDEPRREMIRRLRVQRLPLVVLLLVPRGQTTLAERGTPEQQPDRLIVLESGRIPEGLLALGQSP